MSTLLRKTSQTHLPTYHFENASPFQGQLPYSSSTQSAGYPVKPLQCKTFFFKKLVR